MNLTQKLVLKKIAIKVLEDNDLPLKSAEALEIFDDLDGTLDDMVFAFSTAIGIDYPELGRERVSNNALMSVALFTECLLQLVKHFDKQGVSDENSFNPSHLFYSWVRIKKGLQERGDDGSACSSGRHDGGSELARLDISKTRH